MIETVTVWSTPASSVLIELLDSMEAYIMLGGTRSI